MKLFPSRIIQGIRSWEIKLYFPSHLKFLSCAAKYSPGSKLEIIYENYIRALLADIISRCLWYVILLKFLGVVVKAHICLLWPLLLGNLVVLRPDNRMKK